ncbi:levansucrase [Arthrobacter sp. SW1]|uniref:glycoside hydrolase family 68 protein n=1 Tax=Arthrobacter sp. SW1 TaxID=1920889 RepID=UPI000877DF1B|nr:glycoside hydrolase family 68 protein [Arthrobacter sp. SW1]OFI38922.1 levansucrase [Arthrobacter sp. SW1]
MNTHSTPARPVPARRLRAAASLAGAGVAASLLLAAPASAAQEPVPGFPPPTEHTQKAYAPESGFTAKWTRADAKQIMAQAAPETPFGGNSLHPDVTMPEIPRDFPVMKDSSGDHVWVWDTWPLTDESGNQVSYKGWDVIFSLVADPQAGYTFDERHFNARIGYWFRPAGQPESEWVYGGHLFPGGTTLGKAEWSGSTRIFDGGKLATLYTAVTDYPATGAPMKSVIAKSEGKLKADAKGISIEGFTKHTQLLEPDGKMYQTGAQNRYYAFRDPYTFEDPAHPGKTFMVFEGNTGGKAGELKCTEADLGGSGEDAQAVTDSGARFQAANIGLAVADNSKLDSWKLLPPVLSANCVNDQTERPQIVIRNEGGKNKYYLFTISHQFTYAAGLRGPDGVYGFVGDGIRSDYQPMNNSGLVLANPTNLSVPSWDPAANPRQFQSYSHYVMPGGLVESFIDNVDGRRGGTLAPTVKIDFAGSTSRVDRGFGNNGLGPYGFIPSNIRTGGNGHY